MKMNTYLRWAVAFAAATLMLSSCNNKKGGDAGGGSAKTKTVKELIQGAWAPDKDSMLAMISEGAELSDADKAQLMPVVDSMLNLIVIELGDGTSTIHKPGGNEEGTYTFVSSDDATGDFEVNMDGEDKGTGNVKGDSMTMTSDGVTMELSRLSAEDFEKRKQAIKESPIPGGG